MSTDPTNLLSPAVPPQLTSGSGLVTEAHDLQSPPEIRSMFPLDDNTLLIATLVSVDASFRPNDFLGNQRRLHLNFWFRNVMPATR